MSLGVDPRRELESALYVGSIRHRRRGDVVHTFRYPLFMVYLDLDELPQLGAAGLLGSQRWPSPIGFRRGDYLGDADLPLAEAVRQRVTAATGRHPRGPIRLLTHLRSFGLVMNPVSFYYCYDPAPPASAGAPERPRLAAILAEVTNTPWGERHSYVLPVPQSADERRLVFTLDKAFHVSPFLPMEQSYRWRFSPPGERLVVHMENIEAGTSVFDATLALRRRAWTRRAQVATSLRHPLMTARVAAWIYLQAARLYLKRAPFFPHPKKRQQTVVSSASSLPKCGGSEPAASIPLAHHAQENPR